MEGMTRITKVALVGLVLAAIALGLGYWVYVRGGTEVQAQADCREVESIGPESTNQRVGPVQINGNTIRVSGEVTADDPDRFSALSINVEGEGEDGSPAFDIVSITETGPFTENILEGPGSFTFDIESTETVEYTVTISDCGASPPGGNDKGGTTSPQPKTPATPPKTSSPAPKTSSTAPKTPTPAPKDSGTLMNAGGPTSGPVPMMPNGSCPTEFPEVRDGACYQQ